MARISIVTVHVLLLSVHLLLRPFRMLHVQSYHADWEWSAWQLDAFITLRKGRPIIRPPRVPRLGSRLDSSVLLLADVITRLHWQQ
jgi:hypothetical protein